LSWLRIPAVADAVELLGAERAERLLGGMQLLRPFLLPEQMP
jgi:hypothetical protein